METPSFTVDPVRAQGLPATRGRTVVDSDERCHQLETATLRLKQILTLASGHAVSEWRPEEETMSDPTPDGRLI